MTDPRATTLNHTQRAVLDYLRVYSRAYGYAPSYREIKRATGIGYGTITYTVKKLARLGYVTRTNKHRSIVVIRRD